MKVGESIKCFLFGKPLSKEEKLNVLRRFQEHPEPGATIEVTERELKWIGSLEFYEMKNNL